MLTLTDGIQRPYLLATEVWEKHEANLSTPKFTTGLATEDAISQTFEAITGFPPNSIPSNQTLALWIHEEIFDKAANNSDGSYDNQTPLVDFAHLIGAQNAIFIFSHCLKLAKHLGHMNSQRVFEGAIKRTMSEHVYTLDLRNTERSFEDLKLDTTQVKQFFLHELQGRYRNRTRVKVSLYALGILVGLGAISYATRALHRPDQVHPLDDTVATCPVHERHLTASLIKSTIGGVVTVLARLGINQLIKPKATTHFQLRTMAYDSLDRDDELGTRFSEFISLYSQMKHDTQLIQNDDLPIVIGNGNRLIDFGKKMLKKVIQDIGDMSRKLELKLPVDKVRLLCGEAPIVFTNGKVLHQDPCLRDAYFFLSIAYHFLITIDQCCDFPSFKDWRIQFFPKVDDGAGMGSIEDQIATTQSEWNQAYHDLYKRLIDLLGGKEALDALDEKYILWAQRYTPENVQQIQELPSTLPPQFDT